MNELRNLSAENEAYFQELKRIWDAAPETGKLSGVDYQASVKNFKLKLGRSATGKSKNTQFWIRNIAAILVLLCAGLWVYNEKFSVQYLVKNTSQKIDSVSLSDGTKIMLAENTSVRYPDHFKGTIREISLLKGQAFFKVHRDPAHPFQIGIGQSKVRVLGTSFNIKYSATNIDVSVATGKVMFLPNQVSKPSILIAGQAISYKFKENFLEIQNGDNANAWLTKELHFVDMPLNEVCEQLSDYYHVRILLVDELHIAKKFNANFKDSSLEEVLRVLKETYKIQINKRDSLITITTTT